MWDYWGREADRTCGPSEVGMDVFRDGPEGGRAGSRESMNGTIALCVAFGRYGYSKCCVDIGGRAWGIPESEA